MTCIVGIAQDDGTAIVAGDGYVSLGGLQLQDGAPKVRQSGRICWGAAGGGRECDLVMAAKLPSWDGRDPYLWAVRRLVPWITERLDDLPGVEEPELMLLLSVGGTLLCLDGRQAVMLPGPYWAVGSAAEVALGALDASRHCAPRTQLRRAQEAVERLCSGVGGEWTVVQG